MQAARSDEVVLPAHSQKKKKVFLFAKCDSPGNAQIFFFGFSLLCVKRCAYRVVCGSAQRSRPFNGFGSASLVLCCDSAFGL